MHVSKKDIEVKLDAPGAVMRQRMDMGEAGGLGKISGEYFSLGAGVDTTELFKGLEGDLCQCPHWGYVLRGEVTVTDSAGKQETVRTDDLFYWPAGHNVKVTADAELIMFSPQREHTVVIDHLREKVRST
jgi:hypothetical protein